MIDLKESLVKLNKTNPQMAVNCVLQMWRYGIEQNLPNARDFGLSFQEKQAKKIEERKAKLFAINIRNLNNRRQWKNYPERRITCPACGVEIITRDISKKYCDNSCRMNHLRRRKKSLERIDI